jgi:Zn-dependent peptidase ImmA (M78 family)
MKHFSLKKIHEVFPRFNERPISEAEFWRACKRFRIVVKQMPLIVDGYHERKAGRYYIIINEQLRGLKWMHTALHEFCHFLFDAPDHSENYVFYRKGRKPAEEPDAGLTAEQRRRKQSRERFADAFATVALLPWPELERLSKEEYVQDNPQLLRLCMDRMGVYNDFQI